MLHKIYFAGGCFWGTEAYFSRLRGVINTLCGYANGNVEDPTYERVCQGNTGYAETVMIEYDHDIISLDKLLTEFFKTINPTAINRQGNDVGTQYRSGIYYDNVHDYSIVKLFLVNQQKNYKAPIVIELLPLRCFYLAEEYHQQYLNKNPSGYCHVNLNLINKRDLK